MVRISEIVGNGEKYALLGLHVDIDPALSRMVLPGNLTCLSHAEIQLPNEWPKWLGSIRVEEVEEASLFVVVTAASSAPQVLNAENRVLQKLLDDFYFGLMLAIRFGESSDGFLLSGSCFGNEIDVRQFKTLRACSRGLADRWSPLPIRALVRGAEIASHLESFSGPWKPENWRLLKCLSIYYSARTTKEILERVHQFTRCIEGLIVPEAGKTTRQFKNRTALFVGEGHHALMGELYEARSTVEHLNEYEYLEEFDRSKRIRFVELEAISESVARTCLERIFMSSDLTKHFGGVEELRKFWALDSAERRSIWGGPVDPLAPLSELELKHISNSQLGDRLAEQP